MRIKINFTPSTTEVSVNHQSFLNSYVHKCLGKNNEYHDKKNDYAISNLIGGFLNKETKTVDFKNGAYFVVSSLDLNFVNKLLIGIISNPDFINDMKFNGVEHVEESFFNGWNYFKTLSPFIVKTYTDKKIYSFLTLDDNDFEDKLEQYLKKKLLAINDKLDLTDFKVIIPKHAQAKVKNVFVKNVINKANYCQINIYTNKEVAKILYNIGIGQSTGSGFGTIYKTENHSIYK